MRDDEPKECKGCNKETYELDSEGLCPNCQKDYPMKTTDSVMREKYRKIGAEIIRIAHKFGINEIDLAGELGTLSQLNKDLASHSLAEARREERIDSYKKALDDMFLEICKLAEPDERQPSAGDLHTNMDDIHSIRTMLLTSFKKEVDLLTGDNPENECKVCHRTSDVVDMSKCPFCEHDQELIREGRAMSDRDTRRGV